MTANAASAASRCWAIGSFRPVFRHAAQIRQNRACFVGESSEFQLRRHGKPADFAEGEPARLALIDARTREMIPATERFHARLKRLDAGWRERDPAQPSAIAALREGLGLQARNGSFSIAFWNPHSLVFPRPCRGLVLR